MKTKAIALLTLLCLCCSACTDSLQTNQAIDLNNIAYIVSFSGSDMYKFENAIMAIYRDGSVNEYKLNSSMSIENGFKTEKDYKFFQGKQIFIMKYQMMKSKNSIYSMLKRVIFLAFSLRITTKIAIYKL